MARHHSSEHLLTFIFSTLLILFITIIATVWVVLGNTTDAYTIITMVGIDITLWIASFIATVKALDVDININWKWVVLWLLSYWLASLFILTWPT